MHSGQCTVRPANESYEDEGALGGFGFADEAMRSCPQHLRPPAIRLHCFETPTCCTSSRLSSASRVARRGSTAFPSESDHFCFAGVFDRPTFACQATLRKLTTRHAGIPRSRQSGVKSCELNVSRARAHECVFHEALVIFEQILQGQHPGRPFLSYL